MVEDTNPIAAKLEISRREFLDLGLRNPLLNYRLLKTRGLEVADELPSEVFRILVEEGRTMSFLSGRDDDGTSLLSQPEEDSDQPPTRHTDARLRTELSSKELQTRLLSTDRGQCIHTGTRGEYAVSGLGNGGVVRIGQQQASPARPFGAGTSRVGEDRRT